MTSKVAEQQQKGEADGCWRGGGLGRTVTKIVSTAVPFHATAHVLLGVGQVGKHGIAVGSFIDVATMCCAGPHNGVMQGPFPARSPAPRLVEETENRFLWKTQMRDLSTLSSRTIIPTQKASKD